MKLLGFVDLLVEPRLDLILLDLRQFLVCVIDVPVELQERELRMTAGNVSEGEWKENYAPSGGRVNKRTISSLHIGQTSLVVESPGFGASPKRTWDERSWARSVMDRPPELLDAAEAADWLVSDGAKGLLERCGRAAACVGGARPLPLPRMRPPPSLRPDMVPALFVLASNQVRHCVGYRALLRCFGYASSDRAGPLDLVAFSVGLPSHADRLTAKGEERAEPSLTGGDSKIAIIVWQCEPVACRRHLIWLRPVLPT